MLAEVPKLLELRQVSIQFGGLKVIDKLSLSLSRGELLGLIGPNGAGKTTAFNLISGVYKPTAGEIFFVGQPISGLKTHQVAQLGIVRTFQNIRLFRELDVLTNILVSMHPNVAYSLLGPILRTKTFRAEEEQFRVEALQLLDIFGLKHLAASTAGDLPYGVQRKLEIIRALAARPKVLLLDEPAAGMNHSEKAELMVLIERIRKEFNLSILLIEHDMKLVMGICERIIVLDHGEVIAEGVPDHIQTNPKVIEAYLGTESA